MHEKTHFQCLKISQSANFSLVFRRISMQVSICKMGKSQGILLPKPILKQLGLVDVADLQVNGAVIEIRPPQRNPREG